MDKLCRGNPISKEQESMQSTWAAAGFDEFLELFKLALPQAYPLRFEKDKQFLFQISANKRKELISAQTMKQDAIQTRLLEATPQAVIEPSLNISNTLPNFTENLNIPSSFNGTPHESKQLFKASLKL